MVTEQHWELWDIRVIGTEPAQQENTESFKHGALNSPWKWGERSDGPQFFPAQDQVLKIITITFHSGGRNKWRPPQLQGTHITYKPIL